MTADSVRPPADVREFEIVRDESGHFQVWCRGEFVSSKPTLWEACLLAYVGSCAATVREEPR